MPMQGSGRSGRGTRRRCHAPAAFRRVRRPRAALAAFGACPRGSRRNETGSGVLPSVEFSVAASPEPLRPARGCVGFVGSTRLGGPRRVQGLAADVLSCPGLT
eukprot:TRINITY_DN5738_c0_g1_i1.p2 TRINITY_DN5738_c0_g1~~TRINITY_DN5738_c0_g1_i1.p2  ORF type:complete len:103 (+),score=4.79 TRINITY_DN5738_c0_g1_i1:187-495(+)